MVAVGAALPLAVAPAASAADDCANATIRAQQVHASQLPDCRAYEMVSPVAKNARIVLPDRFFSATGDQLMYTGNGPMLESLNGLSGQMVASRGADGWTSTPIVGPTPGRFPTLSDSVATLAASEDLSRVLTQTSYPFDPRDRGLFGTSTVPSSRDLYRFQDGGDVVDWVSEAVADPDLSKETVDIVRASPDVSRVVMQTSRRLVPEVVTETVHHVYLHVDGQPVRLVSVLPDGTPVTERTTSGRQASASADATRIAFTAGPSGSQQLYVRLDADDLALARTVDAAVGNGGETCSNAILEELSPDGSRVRFSCQSPLVPDAGAAAYYERNLDTGVTRLVDRVGDIVTRSDDHSLVVGTRNGVVLARDGAAETMLEAAAPGTSETTAAISPDNRFVVFDAGQPVDRPESGTEYQVYRYEVATGELVCVSCPPDGSTPTGRGMLRNDNWQPAEIRAFKLNQVTEDGRVFFSTASALVPEDTNGVGDVYQWDEGGPQLLSTGTHPAPSALIGATPDVRTVFMTTLEGLVPQDTDNGLLDIYAVRVDGGFAVADEPACRSACQGPIGGPAPAPPVVTVDFRGPGNPVADDGPEPAKVRVSGKRSVTGTSGTIAVRVPASGRITASGSGLRAVTRSATKAGSVSVPVRLSERSRSTLKRRGRLTVRATVRFAPQLGPAQTTRVSVTFKQAKKTKAKGRSAGASRPATSGKGGR